MNKATPQFKVDDGYMYFRPAKPIKCIRLNLVVTKTGVQFEELIGNSDQ